MAFLARMVRRACGYIPQGEDPPPLVIPLNTIADVEMLAKEKPAKI
jgi:hypothetical protein